MSGLGSSWQYSIFVESGTLNEPLITFSMDRVMNRFPDPLGMGFQSCLPSRSGF